MAVQFNEPPQIYHPTQYGQASGITGLVVKSGLAKNGRQANLILFALLIISIILTFVIILSERKEEIITDKSINPETNLPYGVDHPR